MNTLLTKSPGERTRDAVIDERIIRHSHYYDAALHRAITETGSPDGSKVLERAAASAAYRALAGAANANAERTLSGLLAETGLGEVRKCDIGPARTELTLEPSDYVRARIEMFGNTAHPACDSSRGVIAGALGAIYGAGFEVEEVTCVAAGDKECRFVAKLSAQAIDYADVIPLDWPAVGPGNPSADLSPAGSAVIDLVEGGGGVPSYGRLWAELYARAAYEFEREIPEKMGAKFGNLASVVLTEAAHVGTFYSIGGLVRSDGWTERVLPVAPDPEEWVNVLIELVNQFGLGAWNVESLMPGERFTVRLLNGYEASAQLALEEKPLETPRCYFARGFVAALMNVVFIGDVRSAKALNQKVYNSLFRSPSSFRAMETRCTACGDPFCEFVATPLSPGILRF